MPNNILITGEPHSGKSTLLAEVVAEIPDAIGLITREIQADNGARMGFEAVASTGETALIAHVTKPGQAKFLRYHLHLDNLEWILGRISTYQKDSVLYLDEIGSMQAFSEKFRVLARSYLSAPNLCLATVPIRTPQPFVKGVIKNNGKPHYGFVTVTPETRAEAKERVLGLVEHAKTNRS